jgi:hypothetical protein
MESSLNKFSDENKDRNVRGKTTGGKHLLCFSLKATWNRGEKLLKQKISRTPQKKKLIDQHRL